MIGETLGSYEIVEQIGVGGMGAVFKGRHKLIDRKVAIKVLLAEYSNRQEAVSRFFNEAKATASLRHPSLVDVIDFGYAKDGSAYLVMEFLEGENLGARLRKVGKLSVPQALEFARQIAMGISVAHAADIVHRDLKPDNVFLVPSPMDPSLEVVKLLDFGIAKIAGKLGANMQKTQTGMMLGTPLYMAPEQCRGAGYVDARSDTYAFGCILFAMLTGRPPFVYEYPGELIAAHLHEPPPRVKSLRPEVPQSLDDLVDQLLAKDPDKRPPNMAALTKALGKIAAEVGIASTSMLPGAGYTVNKRTTAALPAAEAPVPRSALPQAEPFGATRVMAPEPAGGPPSPAQSTKLLAPEGEPAGKGAGSTTLSSGAGEVTHAGTTEARTKAAPKGRAPLYALGGVIVAAGIAIAVFTRSGAETAQPAEKVAAKPAVVAAPVTPPPPAVERSGTPELAAPPPAESEKAAEVAEPAPVATTADENTFVFVRVKNARPGLEALVDGQKAALPIKLPKDGKTHTLRFETPNFHPEVHSFKPTRNRVITLENKPFLFVE